MPEYIVRKSLTLDVATEKGLRRFLKVPLDIYLPKMNYTSPKNIDNGTHIENESCYEL